MPLEQSLKAAERKAQVRALEHTGGKRNATARVLSVSRTTLYNKLLEYVLI